MIPALLETVSEVVRGTNSAIASLLLIACCPPWSAAWLTQGSATLIRIHFCMYSHLLLYIRILF